MSQIITNVIGGIYHPYAFESLTVSSSAIPLTASVYNTVAVTSGANPLRQVQYVVITTETNSIRYRYDGTAPTASIGHLMTAGTALVLIGYDTITQFQAIASGADATIMVTYEC